ncbi:unnamed protein product, partial [Rotaria sp. Silwood2]
MLPPLDLSIQQSGYQPKTLSIHNMKRWHSLPKFPSLNIDDQSSIHLLLTNVPLLNLCVEEIFRRQHGCDDLICYENVSDPSIIRQDTHLLYQLFINLSQQWRVSVPLLAYNYEQMISSMFQLSLEDFVCHVSTLRWTIDEWKYALEFYLQMDVDCFYLKTCSFRNSKPRSIDYINQNVDEGLFCINPPEAHYGMKQCSYHKCRLCHIPICNGRYASALKFTDHQIHTFVNQYQAILNCDVNCSSTNVIYTLTCPCQKYDYVGRTNDSFYERLYYHCLQCSRIMREFLLGETIVNRFGQPSLE